MKKYNVYAPMITMMLSGFSLGLSVSVFLSRKEAAYVAAGFAVVSLVWSIVNLYFIKKGD